MVFFLLNLQVTPGGYFIDLKQDGDHHYRNIILFWKVIFFFCKKKIMFCDFIGINLKKMVKFKEKVLVIQYLTICVMSITMAVENRLRSDNMLYQ